MKSMANMHSRAILALSAFTLIPLALATTVHGDVAAANPPDWPVDKSPEFAASGSTVVRTILPGLDLSNARRWEGYSADAVPDTALIDCGYTTDDGDTVRQTLKITDSGRTMLLFDSAATLIGAMHLSPAESAGTHCRLTYKGASLEFDLVEYEAHNFAITLPRPASSRRLRFATGDQADSALQLSRDVRIGKRSVKSLTADERELCRELDALRKWSEKAGLCSNDSASPQKQDVKKGN